MKITKIPNMKSIKVFVVFLLLALTALGLSAKSDVRTTKVYMFGFALSLTDSVVYLTDVQAVDSAQVEKKYGFLYGRSLYAAQLQSHIENTHNKPNTTCVVFFNPKKSKLEGEYIEIRKRYSKDKDVILTPVGVDAFQFQREEYYDVND